MLNSIIWLKIKHLCWNTVSNSNYWFSRYKTIIELSVNYWLSIFFCPHEFINNFSRCCRVRWMKFAYNNFYRAKNMDNWRYHRFQLKCYYRKQEIVGFWNFWILMKRICNWANFKKSFFMLNLGLRYFLADIRLNWCSFYKPLKIFNNMSAVKSD